MDKVVELGDGGYVINGAYPVLFSQSPAINLQKLYQRKILKA